MGIIAAIVTGLVQFLGSSAFADAMHALFSDFHVQAYEGQFDTATKMAVELLNKGNSLADTVSAISKGMNIAEHHTMAIVAAAKAHMLKHPVAAPASAPAAK